MIEAVKCKRGCDDGVAEAGSVLAVQGTGLRRAEEVDFTGSALEGDEAVAAPRGATKKRLLVTVPQGASTGPLVVIDDLEQASEPSDVVDIVEAAALENTSGPIATAVTVRKAFVDGTRRPTLTYRLQTGPAAKVTVSVVSMATRKTVETIDEGEVTAGEKEVVSWTSGQEGRYAFVVSAVTDGASAAQSSSPDAFTLIGHKFPIRGKHEYGDGFGADRGHEGVDVFAKCGTPLVAARGGTVKIKRYHGRAGNYVVIDETRTDIDSVYMHLRDEALVDKNERVHTGQPIGFVGDTGRASGCHLHFERWSGPGWYTGGSAFDPLPELQAWDELS